MRKFLAIQRDSFREAVDGYIFVSLLVLSGIVILLVASASVTPLSVQDAIPKIFSSDSVRIVSADRGAASRVAIFFFQVQTSNVTTVTTSEQVWNSEIVATIKFESSPIGPGGVETGDTKNINPADIKKIDGDGFFSDPLSAPARYWAAPLDAKDKPQFDDELAAEFLKYQVKSACGVTLSSVKRKSSGVYEVRIAGGIDRVSWPHKPSLFFGSVPLGFYQRPLGELVYTLESRILNSVGAWVILLAGVVVTAGFVPSMLRKGAIDLMLVKPLSRPSILLYKYFGGLIFVFVITAFTVAGIWLAVGLRTGIWSSGVFFAVFGITFYFAILYACSTMAGVITRNAIVSIIVTVAFWLLMYLISLGHNIVSAMDMTDLQRTQATRQAKPTNKQAMPAEEQNSDEEDKVDSPNKPARWLVSTLRIANDSIPRINDLDTVTSQKIGINLVSDSEQRQNSKQAGDVNLLEALLVSGAYIAVFLGLALLRFVTRSY